MSETIYVDYDQLAVGQSGSGTLSDPFLIDSTADFLAILDGSYASHPTGSRLTSGDKVIFLGEDELNYGNIQLCPLYIKGLTIECHNKRGAKVTTNPFLAYDVWTNGESITAGAQRDYGTALYEATSTGTTSGTNPLDDTGVTWIRIDGDDSLLHHIKDIWIDFSGASLNWMGRLKFSSGRLHWNHWGTYASGTAGHSPFVLRSMDFVVKSTYTQFFRDPKQGFDFRNTTWFIDKDSGDIYNIADHGNSTSVYTLVNCIITSKEGDTSPVSFYHQSVLHPNSSNNWTYNTTVVPTNLDSQGSTWPMFADPDIYDFDLKPNSPVKNLATGIAV